MADTVGSLVDKLATVNNKLFMQQELIYEIRRMDFDQFKRKYLSDEGAARVLFNGLHKLSDLNIQRTSLVTEIDQKVAEMIKAGVEGRDLDDGNFVQRPHKTV